MGNSSGKISELVAQIRKERETLESERNNLEIEQLRFEETQNLTPELNSLSSRRNHKTKIFSVPSPFICSIYI